MNTDTRSLNELPLDPHSRIIPPAPDVALEGAMPALKPLELWAFLENSDFVRCKDGSLYRQD